MRRQRTPLRWFSRTNIINEGSVYVFAYFGIGNNSGYYRTSRHEFRLNFQPITTTNECTCDKIPMYGLKLVGIPEILQAYSNYPYLVDFAKYFRYYGDVDCRWEGERYSERVKKQK